MTRALVIGVDGSQTVKDLDGYDALSAEVGGWIEVFHFDIIRTHGYLNEEGKLEGLAKNALGTVLMESGDHLVGDYVAGNLVIFGGIDDEGNDTDVTDEQVAAVAKLAEKFRVSA